MKLRLLFIASIALLVGCAKQGPIGLTGEQGQSGTNGIANIKTVVDSLPVSSWQGVTGGFNAVITVPNITVADSDNVSISIATSNNSGSTWYTLPYSGILTTGDQMEFSYSRYEVTLFYSYTTAPAQTLFYKITVAQPSGINNRNQSASGQAQN